MKKTVRTNKGGWFSVAITLILFGGNVPLREQGEY